MSTDYVSISPLVLFSRRNVISRVEPLTLDISRNPKSFRFSFKLEHYMLFLSTGAFRVLNDAIAGEKSIIITRSYLILLLPVGTRSRSGPSDLTLL